MKWYGFILIAAILFVVFLAIQPSTPVEEQVAPTANVVAEPEMQKEVATLQYDLYIVGNEVLPVTYEATAGDTVVLAVVDTAGYDTIDFQVPELGIVEELDVGDEVVFTVPEEGNFDFFCMTCSPALQGNILVHK